MAETLAVYQGGYKFIELTLENGVLNGPAWRWFAGGYRIRFTGFFKDGRPHGPFSEYFTDGQEKSRVYFTDGLPDGPFFQWFWGGGLHSSGMLNKGSCTGHLQSWYPNGLRQEQSEYIDGFPVVIAQWHSNGSPRLSYRSGEKLLNLDEIDDLCCYWRRSGKLHQTKDVKKVLSYHPEIFNYYEWFKLYKILPSSCRPSLIDSFSVNNSTVD